MTGGRLIKVCGLTQAANIRAVETAGADMLGFIFYGKSPRCIRAVPEYLPESASRVGVFVNAEEDEILAADRNFHFSHIQLHGEEGPALCRRLKGLGFRTIKAFSIGPEGLDGSWRKYEDCCDLFLFDTRTPSVGGSGQNFDWRALEAYDGSIPFLLSGGIGPDSIQRIKEFDHPHLAGYDLNSRFETAPGIKDATAVRQFIDRLSGTQIQDNNGKIDRQ